MRLPHSSLSGLAVVLFVANVVNAGSFKTEAVEVHDRVIIAFVPLSFKAAADDGAIEGAAHLRFAVEDTYKCLQPMKVLVKFLYADRVSVRNGVKSQVLLVHGMGQAVGAILVEPGRKAVVVFSVDGPSTLQYLLPQAAAKYWQVKACEQ